MILKLEIFERKSPVDAYGFCFLACLCCEASIFWKPSLPVTSQLRNLVGKVLLDLLPLTPLVPLV